MGAQESHGVYRLVVHRYNEHLPKRNDDYRKVMFYHSISYAKISSEAPLVQSKKVPLLRRQLGLFKKSKID